MGTKYANKTTPTMSSPTAVHLSISVGLSLCLYGYITEDGHKEAIATHADTSGITQPPMTCYRADCSGNTFRKKSATHPTTVTTETTRRRITRAITGSSSE